MIVATNAHSPLFPGERTVVTIGAYDGLHVGHRSVISAVRSEASRRGARSAVITFDRHPASIVRPENAPRLLTNHEQRIELFAETGVDAAVVLPFGETESLESPESFVDRVLLRCLAIECISVGEDFHFGHKRAGNVDLLRSMGADHDFDVVPMSLVGRLDGVDEPISSTAIRRALAGGDVRLAAVMLDRLHEVRGVVGRGDQRGRQIGFPTANVEVSGRLCLPADGVYAGWYERPDGSEFPCAINIGRRPTFYDHAATSLLEAHLIGFTGDLYDEPAKVRFVEFLRSERKFDGLDAITAQLARDVAHAQDVLGVA